MKKPYAIGVNLEGAAVLVVGAGAVGERKALKLLDYGARVTVVSPEATPAIRELSEAGRLCWRQRAVTVRDLEGVRLVFVVTDDTALNQRITREARKKGILVNRADDGSDCDFVVPATVSRGMVQIAILTGGHAPVLSRWLRMEIERILGEEITELAQLTVEVRKMVMEMESDQKRRAKMLEAVLQDELVQVLRQEGYAAARDRAEAKIRGGNQA